MVFDIYFKILGRRSDTNERGMVRTMQHLVDICSSWVRSTYEIFFYILSSIYFHMFDIFYNQFKALFLLVTLYFSLDVY